MSANAKAWLRIGFLAVAMAVVLFLPAGTIRWREVAHDQRVISTGPYAIVRHPMYSGGLLLFIGTPLALGSYWGLPRSLLCCLRSSGGSLMRSISLLSFRYHRGQSTQE